MTDKKADSEDLLQSPTSIEQNSTTCANSCDNNPKEGPTPGGNDQLFANNALSGTFEVEVKKQSRTNPTEKGKKNKKKKSETLSGDPNSTQALSFNQPPVPVYCKKCLGRNIGKKGERSDAYVINCSKCGAHEVLLKPDGNGVVRMSDPGAQALPQGDLLDAAWKSVGDKVFSALQLKDDDNPKTQNEEISSRITTFAQSLQLCSRECADLYPLIINLRSLQLKKNSSTPQQRNILETEVKDRLSLLEEGIGEIESFEAKYIKKSPPAHISSGPDPTAARKEKCPSTQSSSSAGATSAGTKDATFRANPSLFDSISPAATSSPAAGLSTSGGEENKTVSGQATASGAANAADSAGAAPLKTKASPWYIQKTEELNSRLEIMHCHLTKYTLMQSLMIQNKMEQDIAKVKRNETEVIKSLHDFSQGLVDQCQNTTKECSQKMEIKKKYIEKKQNLLVEARILAENCIANGDQEGLLRIEEMLRQNTLDN